MSITFAVADFTIASAAFFMVSCVVAAASLAASADFLLKSSILDCCSLSLALKSATESSHQRDRSSKKPCPCGESALAGSGGGTLCGVVCCGPAGAAGAAAVADDGGAPLCASAAAESQASNDIASKAPQTRSRVAKVAILLLDPGVTAAPPWPIAAPDCGQSTDHPHDLFGLKLGDEIGRQQGQKRRITALKSNRKSSHGLLVACAGAFAPSDPDKPCHRRHQQRHDDGIEAVKQAAESRVAVPPRTEHHADISEAETPRPGPEKRIDLEFHHRHARQSGGKGDERAHHRQQPADEDRDRAVTGKEMLGAIELGGANQDVTAPAFECRAAALGRHVIGDGRTDIAAERARGCGADQAELSDGDEIASERHDDFRRQRNTGGLDRHENDDAEIAAGGNYSDDPGRERRNDLIEHYR